MIEDQCKNYDNGAGLRALFYGLCSFWDIRVREPDDPSDPSDFTLPAPGGGRPAYVVVTPEPSGRQVEIASLLSCGNRVLVLDRDDLDNLRLASGREEAAEVISNWVTYDTHGTVMRRRLGITS
jgi:hypothetical protein